MCVCTRRSSRRDIEFIDDDFAAIPLPSFGRTPKKKRNDYVEENMTEDEAQQAGWPAGYNCQHGQQATSVSVTVTPSMLSYFSLLPPFRYISLFFFASPFAAFSYVLRSQHLLWVA